MKIPRLSSAGACYTLEQWAHRMAWSQLALFGFLVALLFYLASSSLAEDNETAKNIFIILGVIFIIPTAFSIVLIVGLLKENSRLLKMWTIYTVIGTIIYTLFLFGIGVYGAVTLDVGDGFILMALSVLYGVSAMYGALVVYNIYLNITERNAGTQNCENI